MENNELQKTDVVLIALKDEFSGNDGTQLTTKDREYPVYRKNNDAKIVLDDGDTFYVGYFYNDEFNSGYIIGTLFKLKQFT